MKLELVPILFSELHKYVYLAFYDDEKLLKQYHICSGTLEQCVSDTINRIKGAEELHGENVEYYSLVLDGKPIGFTVIIKTEGANELHSFGINIHYRTSLIKTMWLEEVEKLIGLPFFIVLWKKNERAINFFLKNGMAISEEGEKYINDNTKTVIVCPQED